MLKDSVKTITNLYEEIMKLKQKGITLSSELIQNKIENKINQSKGQTTDVSSECMLKLIIVPILPFLYFLSIIEINIKIVLTLQTTPGSKSSKVYFI